MAPVAPRYLFYLRYESGSLYKPAQEAEVVLKAVDGAESRRLRSIWTYWETGAASEEVTEGGRS